MPVSDIVAFTATNGNADEAISEGGYLLSPAAPGTMSRPCCAKSGCGRRGGVALGWMLFGRGDRHATAEMLYEEAVKAKVPVSLATIYNTLHQFTEAGLSARSLSTGQRPISIRTCPSTIISSLKARTLSLTYLIPKWSSAAAGTAEGYEIVRIDVVVRLRRKAP